MDTRQGNMVDMDFINSLKQKNDPSAKWYKEIPDVFLPELEGMNRHQRRKWYSENKKRIEKYFESQKNISELENKLKLAK